MYVDVVIINEIIKEEAWYGPRDALEDENAVHQDWLQGEFHFERDLTESVLGPQRKRKHMDALDISADSAADDRLRDNVGEPHGRAVIIRDLPADKALEWVNRVVGNHADF
jgi:hypothetical protein